MEPKNSLKRLTRSQKGKVFFGVCAGLGDYLGVDLVLIRVIWIVLTILSGVFPGVVAYLLVALVMPKK